VSYRSILKQQLIVDEGVRLKPYRDTVGKLTIGVGRNLDDKGLRLHEAMALLENDMRDAEDDAAYLFRNFESLSDARKAVVVNMAFNMGRDVLRTFRRFIAAVEACDWEKAAVEMLDSKWARQVGPRAERLASEMKKG